MPMWQRDRNMAKKFVVLMVKYDSVKMHMVQNATSGSYVVMLVGKVSR